MSKPLSSSTAHIVPNKTSIDKDISRHADQPTNASSTQSSALTQPTHSAQCTITPSESTTPPRQSRSQTRYQDLGVGRVPLHRRGTSKTYERLEDLLREAGYKETRVFTPEAERVEASKDRDGALETRLSSMKESVGAVVGFLAGLMPAGNAGAANVSSRNERAENPSQLSNSPQEYSPPLSPLVNRPLRKQSTQSTIDISEPLTSTNLTSSSNSLGDLARETGRQWSSFHPNHPNPTHSQTHPPYPQNRTQLVHRQLSTQRINHRTSQGSLRHQAHANMIEIASPRPSRAALHLRHMASTQSIPTRPNSTPVQLFKRPSVHLDDAASDATDSTYVPSKRDNNASSPPWIVGAIRGILAGDSAPQTQKEIPTFLFTDPYETQTRSSSRSKAHTLRPTRSSLSQASFGLNDKRRRSQMRSGLSDRTNATFLPPPHPLLCNPERGRADRLEGQVMTTRVVCRSAPGSRAGSLVRSGSASENSKDIWGALDRGRSKRRRGDKGRVPSLARTKVEGDIWESEDFKRKGRAKLAANDLGIDVDSEGDSGRMSGTDDEDDEDHGEINLERILIHPKRQNSIKSLRKHLVGSDRLGASGRPLRPQSSSAATAALARAGRGMNLASSSSGGVAGLPNKLLRQPTKEDGEFREEWGAGWVRQGRGSRCSDDDDESYMGIFGEGSSKFASGGSGRANTGKNRLGFNGAWGLIGGS